MFTHYTSICSSFQAHGEAGMQLLSLRTLEFCVILLENAVIIDEDVFFVMANQFTVRLAVLKSVRSGW